MPTKRKAKKTTKKKVATKAKKLTAKQKSTIVNKVGSQASTAAKKAARTALAGF